jgi:uncharacterized membrane protein
VACPIVHGGDMIAMQQNKRMGTIISLTYFPVCSALVAAATDCFNHLLFDLSHN